MIYPTIVSDQPAYRGGGAECRVVSDSRSRELAGRILSLPVFPELREDEVRAVAAAIQAFYAER